MPSQPTSQLLTWICLLVDKAQTRLFVEKYQDYMYVYVISIKKMSFYLCISLEFSDCICFLNVSLFYARFCIILRLLNWFQSYLDCACSSILLLCLGSLALKDMQVQLVILNWQQVWAFMIHVSLIRCDWPQPLCDPLQDKGGLGNRWTVHFISAVSESGIVFVIQIF